MRRRRPRVGLARRESVVDKRNHDCAEERILTPGPSPLGRRKGEGISVVGLNPGWPRGAALFPVGTLG